MFALYLCGKCFNRMLVFFSNAIKWAKSVYLLF